MTPREPLAHRLQGFGASIFAEMTALAVSTGAINLGQGFPDYDGPRDVLDEAIRNVAEGNNQYPPGIGVPALREAIAHHQKRFWNLSYDPDSEVLVTMGATEALAGALLGILNTNDEVVVFEPLFDTYAGCVALAGAHLSPVTLQPQSDGRYGFDADQLRNVITPNTRM
ncbi:MAG: aminotransferase class I/II-fold pyridoxal phosphate-dependent enzyme, partial [Acidimicrobiaceae bacterium]